jgi:hypothetical protein
VAFDPQTWRRLTDAQFRFLIKELRSNSRYESMQMSLQWAAMNRDADFYRALLHHARQFMPRYFATWELEAAWLEETGAAVEKRAAFWQSWISNFRDEMDLRTRGQVALLKLYRDNGHDREAGRLESDILKENKSQRFDLAITVGAESVFLLMDRGDWDAAAKEYEKMLSGFRLNSGGHLFYNLVQPYVERCLAAGKRETAKAALENLDRLFRPTANSMLDQDLAALRTQVGK